ncbi:MAG: hypothetical protein JXB39_13670 [Deltaproteobacteria bacterium]|nr:hypothetical protein [Deltaproteobacteria bacterium]
MSALLSLLLLAGPARTAALVFDRVDLVSEDPATWLNYDVPMVGVNTTTVAVRWIEQVKVSWRLPVQGLSIGTSLASLSVFWEHPVWSTAGISAGAGLQTALLLPRGVFADVAWRKGRFRVAAGVGAVSGATWADLDWTAWNVVPTLGLGVGRCMPPRPGGV